MKIIAFTGMPFSGKTEAVKIAKNLNFPVIRMGDIIWEKVIDNGLKLNDKNVGEIANNMRDKFGNDIWAKKTIEKIKSMGNVESVIIDGIRNVEEIVAFKKGLGKNLILIAIETSDIIRINRALKRRRKDDTDDINKIKERDQREIRWGLKKVIDSADIKILNENNLEVFRKKIKDILLDL